MTLIVEAEAIPLVPTADGTFRIGKTRISLDIVVYAYKNGLSPEQIVQSYPTLLVADVYAVITYYLRHQAEVDAYIAQNEHEAEALKAQFEARSDYKQLRERLIARRTRQLN